MDARDLTFGEKAVGLTFNPSGDDTVRRLKELYAQIINICNAKTETATDEQLRLWSIAIEHAQTAQMWAVKAQTWKG